MNEECVLKNLKLEKMKSEKERLLSFRKGWPVMHSVKPKSLAAAGFYYLQTRDWVMCHFCRLVLTNWKPGDDPLEEHEKFRPNCSFLQRKREDAGVDCCTNFSKIYKIYPVIEQQQRYDTTTFNIKKDPSKSLFSEMKSELKRLLSFHEKGWIKYNMVSSERLAAAGFFFLKNMSDDVQCAFCGIILQDWNPGDVPLRRHMKKNPKCPYMTGSSSGENIPIPSRNKFNYPLTEMIRQQRVEEEKKLWVEEEPLKPNCFSKSIECKSKQQQQLKNNNGDKLLCKICYDEEVGITFQPCGHCMTCEKCAEIIFDCPMCREHVNHKIKVYL